MGKKKVEPEQVTFSDVTITLTHEELLKMIRKRSDAKIPKDATILVPNLSGAERMIIDQVVVRWKNRP